MNDVTAENPKGPILTEKLGQRLKPQREKLNEDPHKILERFSNPARQIPINAIEPKHLPRASFSGRNDIEELVEPPLKEAVTTFYKRGVQTLSTGANQEDIKVGFAHIVVDYSSLSPENQAIAQKLATRIIKPGESFDKSENTQQEEIILDLSQNTTSEGRPTIFIKIPLTQTSTHGQVEDASIAIAQQFKDQPMTWVDIKTTEAFAKENGMNPTDVTDLDLAELGYFRDPATYFIYPSKELFIEVKKREAIS